MSIFAVSGAFGLIFKCGGRASCKRYHCGYLDSCEQCAKPTYDKGTKIEIIGEITIDAKIRYLGRKKGSTDGYRLFKRGDLEVTASTVAVTGVTLNKSSTALTVGATETLTATVAPSNATNKGITWSSGNPSKATVDGIL